MTWTNTQVDTSGMDAGTDSPGAARAQIKQMADVVNQMLLTFNRVTMGASNIDLATGNAFTRTISGATTFTLSNVPAAPALCCFVLDLTNGGSATITWWSGLKWPGGAAPTLTASGRDVLGFFTHDGGSTWTGMLLARDAR